MSRVCVGLDVSSKTIAAHAIDSTTGEVRTSCFGGSDFGGIASWVNSLGDNCEVVYEAGSYGFGLARFLIGMGVECVVTEPGVLGANRKKTDAVDAEGLARLLVARTLPLVTIPSETQESQRRLARIRYDLSEFRKVCKHRLASFKFCCGVKDLDAFTTQRLLRGPDRIGHDAQIDILNAIEREIGAIDEYICSTVRDTPCLSRLTDVSGVGAITAFTATAEAIDFTRFDTARAYASYVGLVPVAKNSGERKQAVRNKKRTASGACFYNAASAVMKNGGAYIEGKATDMHNEVIKEAVANSRESKAPKAGMIARVIAEEVWRFSTSQTA